MKNNIIISVSVAILLVTNIFTLKKNRYYVDALNYKDSLIQNQNFIKQQLDYIEGNLFTTLKYQNTNIATDIAEYYLDTILSKQQYIFVYRYHDTDCEACINSGIIKLKKLSQKIGKNKIIILVKTTSKRILQIARNTYNIDFPMFIVDSLPMHLDQFNIPYYFILDQNMDVNNLFIPDKTIPVYTDKYMSEILHKYFE